MNCQTFRGYLAVQLWLYLLYVYSSGGVAVAAVAVMYLTAWRTKRLDLWMRNRDERGRFVRGYGPVSA